MKNELRDSALWAVVVSFLSAIALLAGTITTAILNRKSKDRETDHKADADIRDDREAITKGYREGYLDCREENKELRAEVLPLRRRAAYYEQESRRFKETLIANGLLCSIAPAALDDPPPAP